ncbi:wax ester synthase/diacylglycerol acyltransferase 4-like [Gastrolobium bilobum]|uniref:wax ester synthase/diacylglycerol acyltransferase 4-like n=1 Tax=Gastrolobium bilobum TaxID=150636 RepID=UPI002AB1E80F|nr:wax ester synthase/diacylglycerol acyltransferase 4-like [Gastrolobium bilobum]
MNEFENGVSMPVSPMADYFSSSVMSVFILGVLESEIPIDDSRAEPLLKDIFLPINTRFSSILMVDEKGKKRWKEVDVCLKEHIKIPIFPTTNMPHKLYDDNLNEYMSDIAMEQLPLEKPLWEMHIFKYPTSSAAGTFIFKLHHALGDGYSLMTTLLSCVQRADNPSIPINFPSSRSSVESKFNIKTMLKKSPQTVSNVFKSVFDFGWSVLKASLIADDKTPIRSGHNDVGFRPITISNVSLSLDSIKEVKNKLKVSINDALVGIIFLGIQLYMETMNHKLSKAETTALVLLNTRKLRAYKPVKEMLDANSEAPWGNRFHFMHVPIPKLNDASSLNPLEFVLEASKKIKRKRNSLAVPGTGMLLALVNRIKGSEAAARYVYKILNNSSLSISHMVGPLEQVALFNHPIKGFYFMTVGLSQSITVTITSYMGYLRVGFGVEKGFIDEHQFKSCFETALEMMLKAARNIATETKQ